LCPGECHEENEVNQTMLDTVAIKQVIKEVINNIINIGLRSKAHYFELKKNYANLLFDEFSRIKNL
jgi:hypothetical protein